MLDIFTTYLYNENINKIPKGGAMARKKIEPIRSLGGDENKLIVQKSLPLFSLWHSDLTLAEFKILDTYLSRIDSHKPDWRVVVIEKGELERIMGVKKINKADLELRLKHLMSNVVKIEDNSTKKGFKLVSLFEEAEAEQDDNGLWQIKLECTAKAMKYFFNIEELGYLRYKLRCITAINSRYTYIMFTYLEHNRFRKSWEIGLEDLKKMLDCDKVETYTAFKEFNKQILKRTQKELHEKTECRYTYTPIKKGRSVVAIRFEVETLPKRIGLDEPQTVIDIDAWKEMEHKDDLWQGALEVFNFTPEQLDQIFSILVMIPDRKLPPAENCFNSIEFMRFHYLDQKAKEIICRDKEKTIRNKFNYLVKMLKQDAT